MAIETLDILGEVRLRLKTASNLDPDEERMKRKIKNVYLPGDSNSSDECTPPKMSHIRKVLPKERTERNSSHPKPSCSSQVGHLTYAEVKIEEISNEVPIMNVNSAVISPIPIELLGSNQKKTNSCAQPAEVKIEEISNEVPIMNVNSAVNSPIPIELFGSNQKKTNSCSQPECIISRHFAIQQSHLIQVVTDLCNQVAELDKKVDVLLERSGGTFLTEMDGTEAMSAELLGSLPVKDENSFNNFNNQIRTTQNKQAIMSYLAGIGGRSVQSLATNMLRRILIDDVAELYSLTGKQMKNSNKKSFINTETFELICQICKKVYGDVTENSMKDIISDWLNQAKVRITRRKERQNKLL